MFTIGGDHTISYGSVSSTLKIDPETVLIWIDAHSDINSPETSCSGNCHGMPVNYILGLTRHKAIGETPKLNPRNLVYMGLRSVDEPEEEILQSLDKKGMLRFTADYIRKNSIESVIEIITERYTTINGKKPNIHISLDIDSIDPEYCPATGTAVEDGIHPMDVVKVIRWANETTANQKCHLDLTEVNPELADLEGAAKTFRVVDQILEAYFERPSKKVLIEQKTADS